MSKNRTKWQNFGLKKVKIREIAFLKGDFRDAPVETIRLVRKKCRATLGRQSDDLRSSLSSTVGHYEPKKFTLTSFFYVLLENSILKKVFMSKKKRKLQVNRLINRQS